MQPLKQAQENSTPNAKSVKRPQSFEEAYHLIEEDEINLLDLLIVVLKHKKMILGMVLLTGLMTLIITLLLTETKLYKSEAIIVPQQGGIASFGRSNQKGNAQFSVGSSSSGKLMMMLDSRGLTAKVIESTGRSAACQRR